MDTELFVHFAEIAGIFVGFGALIGLRNAQVIDLRAFNTNLEPIYRYLPVIGVPMHLIIAGSLVLIIIGV